MNRKRKSKSLITSIIRILLLGERSKKSLINRLKESSI